MRWNWKLFGAVATLTGTIIGAGFLGIPYVVAKSGFIIGLIQIIFLGLILMIVKLGLGEVLLRTKATHQLPGLAKLYLGKTGYRIMLFSMIFGVYAALIAYLIGVGESLSFIFTGSVSYALYFAVGFWVLMSVIVYRGLQSMRKTEMIGIGAILGILIFIVFYFLDKINIENLLTYDFSYVFLPVGVIMFALLGFSSIPEVMRELKGSEKLMKKSIIYGTILPIVIYSLFTFVVIGFVGQNAPEIATFALGKVFILLGIFTMLTSFLVLAIAIQDTYKFDLKISKKKSFLLACGIPLVLFFIIYLLKIASFTGILGIGGIVTGGLTGILILLMTRKARKLGKRKPEYSIKLPPLVVVGLIILFISGMLLQLIF